ncbi:MAG: hypothetical protein KY432_05465 [Acidobacteria bacterium]|nr:hypothetical protein [Acidobacteriota bacterium]
MPLPNGLVPPRHVIPTDPAKRESGGISQDVTQVRMDLKRGCADGFSTSFASLVAWEIPPLRSPASRDRYGRDDGPVVTYVGLIESGE